MIKQVFFEIKRRLASLGRNYAARQWFWRQWRIYQTLPGAEPLRKEDLWVFLHDRTSTTPFDPHYFYQAVWAAKEIYKLGHPEHVDVGSDHRFVGQLTAFTKVIFIDLRPLPAIVEDLECRAGNILSLPFRDASIMSLSCLHVAEHIGLGRYGDALDPRGTEKACKELARVLASQGSLLFSVPIGKARVQFNAHRIHTPKQILDYFSELELVSFSAVNDTYEFVPNADPAEFADSKYACGMFHFKKP
jgi:SAM-dependent methyltransferase